VKWDAYYNYTSDYADDTSLRSQVTTNVTPGTPVPGEKFATITSTVPAAADRQHTTDFKLEISDAVAAREFSSGDQIWVSIRRDPNVFNNYGTTVYAISMTMLYFTWCEGSHILLE
jgi:hypothetical protein